MNWTRAAHAFKILVMTCSTSTGRARPPTR